MQEVRDAQLSGQQWKRAKLSHSIVDGKSYRHSKRRRELINYPKKQLYLNIDLIHDMYARIIWYQRYLVQKEDRKRKNYISKIIY